MLLVGTASYAQPGPVAGANSSLVGQTGTSQGGSQLEHHKVLKLNSDKQQ
jgi:hypothetical protein